MWRMVLINCLAKWWEKEAVPKIERQDYATKALQKLYKIPKFKWIWIPFLNGVEEIVQDILSEIRAARSWSE